MYGRGIYALRDVSIVVEKGDFVFLTGPSGAGKSTLLRLLLRQELASEGIVSVAGRDLAKLTPSQAQSYRRAIGFVFQDFKLIQSKSVLDNVGLVPRVLGATSVQQQRRTFQVLKWLGLQHRMNAYPLELSGGEQQRVAIARALVNEPSLILADEPTGNLDTRTSLEIMEIFQNLNRESRITIILVTHEPDIARYAGRHVVFRDGKVIQDERIQSRQAADDLTQLP